MKVPRSHRKLLDFSRDLIEICTYSQAARAQDYSTYVAYYEDGDDGKISLYNRTGVHIDRTASYLYAPGDIRYSIGFDATEGEPWLNRAGAASKYLSREYRRADGDILFSQGVKTSLIKGCSIVKHNWMERDSIDFNLVHPEFFGVEREDLERLEDQQAMVHTCYLTKNQLMQLIRDRQDEEEIRKQLKKVGGVTDSDTLRQNWLHQVVIAGTNPVQIGTPQNATDQVSMSPSSKTHFHPDMMAELLRIDELWVVDDDRQDYTTIQLVEGEIFLEGKYRHRNLTGVEGLHPFSKVCADPVSGYFWGRSEVGRVMPLQDMLNERMVDIRKLLKLRLRPPKGLIGFSGNAGQKLRAAMAPGGYITEQNPNAKIQELIPTIPPEAFAEVEKLSDMFDEVGGFKPILQGQGEPGVRANAHARTLMRTASPKLRERALYIERDAETSAYITFQLMQAKDARVFLGGETKEHFYLAQMPKDFYVEIDSHSASPVFVDDARELAFALKKLGSIDDIDLIRLTRPPMQDQLIESSKKRQAAKQKMLQEHPELLSGGKKKAA